MNLEWCYWFGLFWVALTHCTSSFITEWSNTIIALQWFQYFCFHFRSSKGDPVKCQWVNIVYNFSTGFSCWHTPDIVVYRSQGGSWCDQHWEAHEICHDFFFFFWLDFWFMSRGGELSQGSKEKIVFNSKFDIGSFLVERFAMFQWGAWGFAMARHWLRSSYCCEKINVDVTF